MERRYRETSRKNWQVIKDDALMRGSHFDLYTIVVNNPDITNGEATIAFNSSFGTSLSRNEIAKRMSNLHYNYKVIEECGTRVCSVQHKEVVSYRSSNALPSKLPTNKKTKNARIAELEDAVERMATLLQHSNPSRKAVLSIAEEVCSE
jgi:hypothetical protein